MHLGLFGVLRSLSVSSSIVPSSLENLDFAGPKHCQNSLNFDVEGNLFPEPQIVDLQAAKTKLKKMLRIFCASKTTFLIVFACFVFEGSTTN